MKWHTRRQYRRRSLRHSRWLAVLLRDGSEHSQLPNSISSNHHSSSLRQALFDIRVFKTVTSFERCGPGVAVERKKKSSLDPIARSLDPIARSLDPIARSLDPIARSLDPIARSLDPIARSLDPIARSLDL